MEHASNKHLSLLEIESWDDLLAQEAELLRRIREFRNGERLILIDPMRLLGDLNVKLGSNVVRAWEKHAGVRAFAQFGREKAYDAVAASRPDGSVKVRIKALFPGRERPS